MTHGFVRRPAVVAVLAALALVLSVTLSIPAPAQGTTPGDPSLAGQLLVATPDLRDPNFSQTVIYMVSHDKDGAMGIVINRLAAIGPLADLLAAFGLDSPVDAGEIRVFSGGPVQRGIAFMLHSPDFQLDETILVNGEIAVTAHNEILAAISRGKGPAKQILAFGYAGWGPGQLEQELEADSWYVVSTNAGFVFDKELATKWQRAVDMRALDL